MDRKFPGSLTGLGGASSSHPCRKGSAANKDSCLQMTAPQATLKEGYANLSRDGEVSPCACSRCYFLWQVSVFGVLGRGI